MGAARVSGALQEFRLYERADGRCAKLWWRREQERLRAQADQALAYFVNYCNHYGLAAKSFLSFGTDPIEELTKLAEVIHADFPDSIFFANKLILQHDNWYIRQLTIAAPTPSAGHADGGLAHAALATHGCAHSLAAYRAETCSVLARRPLLIRGDIDESLHRHFLDLSGLP
jgi:hypothetical protein